MESLLNPPSWGPAGKRLLGFFLFFTPSLIIFAKQAQNARRQNKHLIVPFLAKKEKRQKSDLERWGRGSARQSGLHFCLPGHPEMFGKPLASTPSPCLSRRCKTEHKPPAIAQRALSARWPWSVSGCLWCAPVCYFKGIPRWCKPCNFWEITSRTKFLFFFATESMTFCVYCWWQTLFQMAAYFLILFFFFPRIYCNGSKSDIISIV